MMSALLRKKGFLVAVVGILLVAIGAYLSVVGVVEREGEKSLMGRLLDEEFVLAGGKSYTLNVTVPPVGGDVIRSSIWGNVISNGTMDFYVVRQERYAQWLMGEDTALYQLENSIGGSFSLDFEGMANLTFIFNLTRLPERKVDIKVKADYSAVVLSVVYDNTPALVGYYAAIAGACVLAGEAGWYSYSLFPAEKKLERRIVIRRIPEEKPKAGEVRCPRCGSPVKGLFCPRCGKRVRAR